MQSQPRDSRQTTSGSQTMPRVHQHLHKHINLSGAKSFSTGLTEQNKHWNLWRGLKHILGCKYRSVFKTTIKTKWKERCWSGCEPWVGRHAESRESTKCKRQSCLLTSDCRDHSSDSDTHTAATTFNCGAAAKEHLMLRIFQCLSNCNRVRQGLRWSKLHMRCSSVWRTQVSFW